VNPTSSTEQLPGLISTTAIDRYRISSDASHFHLIPKGVATPSTVDQIAELFKYATTNRTSVTFRSGGTSLSGQAVTDGVLIDTRRHFRSIEVLNGGAQVRVQPGATVRAVNARLARFGRKLGPDPASEIACTIGGVIANNSSGMACGITENTYQTLQSATVLLANGEIINTADSDSDLQLKVAAPELYFTLQQIKAEISARPDLSSEITRQYQIKNTMGYGLNSFVDHTSILDIFLHLLIGSEGTLGFISEAFFNTVPLLSHAATTLLIFENLTAATDALPPLLSTNPATIELMDSASLRAGKVDMQGVELKEHAALLVEYQVAEESELLALISAVAPVHARFETVNKPDLTTDQKIRNELWHIRKGLYAAVAGARRSGTTALLEDISVPVHQLASTCLELRRLFAEHGYDDAVIFGHAKDGNIHFLLNENFKDPQSVERYRLFTEEMVDLVLGKGGSLKAEHGTGRMMAPFVKRQFGSELYDMMVRIKQSFDPSGILNPGIIISSDSLAHMHHIKFNPPIQKVADSCVECGYCEPICPSKDLTTTPRQRIVLQRAIATARSEGDDALLADLVKAAEYHVEETCAVDGLCESSCPVGINTGTLVTELRQKRNEGTYSALWSQAAEHWNRVLEGISTSLSLARALPTQFIEPINDLLRNYLGEERVPLWSDDLPRGGKPRTPSVTPCADFVLFASCLESIFQAKTSQALKSLANKAGLTFTTPADIADLCCATPWKSKGLTDGYASMVEATYQSLVESSENGRLPIVCENSSCTEGLLDAIKSYPHSKLRIIDAIDFTVEFILPQLEITRKKNAVALHPTCSSTLLGSNTNFETLAAAISEKATTPLDWGCCAFAGDRGLLHPELTASALRAESVELKAEIFDAYLSTNLTCEIGMSRATGKDYQHILVTLDELARSKKS
jgi:D-lactate dehydrogenase